MTNTQKMKQEDFWAQEDIFETGGAYLIWGLVICFAAVVVICALTGVR